MGSAMVYSEVYPKMDKPNIGSKQDILCLSFCRHCRFSCVLIQMIWIIYIYIYIFGHMQLATSQLDATKSHEVDPYWSKKYCFHYQSHLKLLNEIGGLSMRTSGIVNITEMCGTSLCAYEHYRILQNKAAATSWFMMFHLKLHSTRKKTHIC